jgi:hypothetical protein
VSIFKVCSSSLTSEKGLNPKKGKKSRKFPNEVMMLMRRRR